MVLGWNPCHLENYIGITSWMREKIWRDTGRWGTIQQPRLWVHRTLNRDGDCPSCVALILNHGLSETKGVQDSVIQTFSQDQQKELQSTTIQTKDRAIR